MNWEPYIIWFFGLVAFPMTILAWTWFWTGPADRWATRYFGRAEEQPPARTPRTRTRTAKPSYKFVSAIDPKAMAAQSKRRRRKKREMARKVAEES